MARLVAIMAMTALLGGLAAPLFAQEAPPWKGNLEFSYLETSGNTDSKALLFSGKVERTFTGSKLTGEGTAVYGQKDGETSDKSWIIKLKYDKGITDRASVFLLESVERNTLKGIEFRYITQIGLGYDFIKTPSDTLKGEVGAGYVRENPVDPFPDRGFPTARLFGQYDHAFAEKTRFVQTAEYIPSLKEKKDYLINEESAFVTNLAGGFAFKVSFSIAYDNLPPPTFSKTDRLFKTALLYTF